MITEFPQIQFFNVFGHSMFPKYPPGCIVAYKATDLDIILWGEDYIIELNDRRILKRVVRSDNKETILAVSYNKNDNYQPIEIPKSKIKSIYMVVSKVVIESI